MNCRNWTKYKVFFSPFCSPLFVPLWMLWFGYGIERNLLFTKWNNYKKKHIAIIILMNSMCHSKLKWKSKINSNENGSVWKLSRKWSTRISIHLRMIHFNCSLSFLFVVFFIISLAICIRNGNHMKQLDLWNSHELIYSIINMLNGISKGE